jgi:hypothetical protein
MLLYLGGKRKPFIEILISVRLAVATSWIVTHYDSVPGASERDDILTDHLRVHVKRRAWNTRLVRRPLLYIASCTCKTKRR